MLARPESLGTVALAVTLLEDICVVDIVDKDIAVGNAFVILFHLSRAVAGVVRKWWQGRCSTAIMYHLLHQSTSCALSVAASRNDLLVP